MKKKLSLLIAFMFVLSCVFAFTSCGCEHKDADDNKVCDDCGDEFDDGCDVHKDKNDDKKCDVCAKDFEDGCDVHVDANDDKKCDVCVKDFEDGCDNHKDANDDGKCDVDGCGKDYTDGCDNHKDANDDGKCDVEGCDKDYTDGCDAEHKDANDDGKCDIGGEDFTDGCDKHKDANDDGKCDVTGCGKDYTDGCDTKDCLDTNNDGFCDNEGCDKPTTNKPTPPPACQHVDANDDGKCDVAGCGENYTDGCDTKDCLDTNDDGFCDNEGCDKPTTNKPAPACKHVDADDNGKCDKCGEEYTDGCDADHKDANDDGLCDFGGEAFEDGCDVHVDADDNAQCDKCGTDFEDGCDADHRDANDDGKCDIGGEEFVDGCDIHKDTDKDGKCDNCGASDVKFTVTVTFKRINGTTAANITKGTVSTLAGEKFSAESIETIYGFNYRGKGFAKWYLDLEATQEFDIVNDVVEDAITLYGVVSEAAGHFANWSFDEATGTLSITGEGKMFEFSGVTDLPWYDHIADIKAVSIADGITYIANNFVAGASQLVAVEIPDSVVAIGDAAFQKTGLTGVIRIGNNVATINRNAFNMSKGITAIIVSDKLQTVGYAAFEGCELANVYFEGTLKQYQSVVVENSNSTYSAAVVSFYSEACPPNPGPYWYYENNAPENWCYALKYFVGDAKTPEWIDYVFVSGAKATKNNVNFRNDIRKNGYAFEVITPSLAEGDAITKDMDFKCFRGNIYSVDGNITAEYDSETATLKINIADLDAETKIWDILSADDVAIYKAGTNELVTRMGAVKVLEIAQGITYIGKNAFAGMSSVERIVIPASVTAIHTEAFVGCKKLDYIYYDNTTNLRVENDNGMNIATLTDCDATIYTKVLVGVPEAGNWFKIYEETTGEGDDAVTTYRYLAWTITEDGVLYVGGDDVMVDFATPEDAPWYVVKDSIVAVVVLDGVTHVSENLVNGYESVETVEIPKSAAKDVPDSAFAGTGYMLNQD